MVPLSRLAFSPRVRGPAPGDGPPDGGAGGVGAIKPPLLAERGEPPEGGAGGTGSLPLALASRASFTRRMSSGLMFCGDTLRVTLRARAWALLPMAETGTNERGRCPFSSGLPTSISGEAATLKADEGRFCAGDEPSLGVWLGSKLM